jgi:hypothetical protein
MGGGGGGGAAGVQEVNGTHPLLHGCAISPFGVQELCLAWASESGGGQ